MKKQLKKLLWEIKGGYKPEQFWDNWAPTFQQDPWQTKTHTQHKWLLSKVRESSPDNILEVGVGFGRNVKFLLENKVHAEVHGTDISNKMIVQAKKYLSNFDVKLYHNRKSKLPLKNKSVDLSFTHGVLMHVKTEDVNRLIAEIIRVTKKDILLLEQNYGGNEYTFIHNYRQILKDQGVKIIEYRKDEKIGLDLIHAQISK